MQDYLLILGLIVGVIFLVIGKKIGRLKILTYIGIFLIIFFLSYNFPDAIAGFIDGFNSTRL